MKVNKIFNEDCFQTIKYISGQGRKVQMVITSPPYNTARNSTYSSDLVTQLIDMYAKPKGIVYDPFMGTGTTALACAMRGLKYIGSEISQDQVKFARKRVKAYRDSVKDN